MRKNALVLILLFASLLGRAGERIYIVTDRNAYIAGDLVYCSLFAVDDNGRISDFSAVSYLELISAEGTATEAKIGLFAGRGAGSFRIPANIPTGNYRLVAYTARSQASAEGARTLAVFNTGTVARVKDGVTIKEDWKPFTRPDLSAGGLTLSLPARLRQGRQSTLVLGGLDLNASLSVSVYHDDGLAPADGKSLETFLQGKAAQPGNRPGEYEGEVILATVEGLEQNADVEHQVTAILSTAGAPSNVYLGRTTNQGHILFYTGNIYGDRELVCEVMSIDGKARHINLSSPFTHPSPGEIEPLVLSREQREWLVSRKASLLADADPETDTLQRFLPKREDLLLDGASKRRYHLDDYTRFSTVREICVEFVTELQYVKRDGRWRIRMQMLDGTEQRHFMQDNILVMMDGVVLSDHGLLEDFDAMLLEDIDIYSQPVVLGGVPYNGVVNFISKKNYVTALKFPENVRVVDFRGVSYPIAYPGGVPQGAQDRRQLLYWHPALELEAGTEVRIPLTMPAYAGRFRAVVEGWKADGTPVRAEYSFEVE